MHSKALCSGSKLLAACNQIPCTKIYIFIIFLFTCKCWIKVRHISHKIFFQKNNLNPLNFKFLNIAIHLTEYNHFDENQPVPFVNAWMSTWFAIHFITRDFSVSLMLHFCLICIDITSAISSLYLMLCRIYEAFHIGTDVQCCFQWKQNIILPISAIA